MKQKHQQQGKMKLLLPRQRNFSVTSFTSFIGIILFIFALIGCQWENETGVNDFSEDVADTVSNGEMTGIEGVSGVGGIESASSKNAFPPSPNSAEFLSIHERSLNKHWNLVSFPITTVTGVQAYIDSLGSSTASNMQSIWKWDHSIGENGAWKVYPQTGEFALLESLSPDEGYWIRARNSFELTGTGVTSNSYNFNAGWNLIGYSHSGSSMSLGDFFSQGDFWNNTCSTSEPVLNVWAWVNNTWKIYFEDDSERVAFNAQYGTSFEALTTIEAGMGVWVNARRDNNPPPAGGCPVIVPKLPDTGHTQSYTEIFGEDHDYSIHPPSYTDNGDGMVLDDNTGLMWEKKTSANKDTTYAWNDAENYCSDLKLAGYSDWRLPTIKELHTVMHYGTYNPTIDTSVFSNNATGSINYWSSTHDVSPNVWNFFFYEGYGSYSSVENTFHARCVRRDNTGNETDIWSFDYTDNGDSTITHASTKLVWQKEDDGSTRDWETALAYCRDLELGGKTDWRLPNIKELFTISTASTATVPSIDTTFFPNTQSLSYWASTTHPYETNKAWVVYFGDGGVYSGGKDNTYYTRCVRGL